MDKLTAIKIKYDDWTYSDEIPVSVLAENVEWDNTHTLVDVLGSINVDATGTIQDQISQLFNEKVNNTQLQNYIVSQLNTDVTTWLQTNVKPVGSAVVVDSSLTVSGAAADAKVVGSTLNKIKDNEYPITLISGKYISYDNGDALDDSNYSATDYIPLPIGKQISIYTPTSLRWCAYYNSNKEYVSTQMWPKGTTVRTFTKDSGVAYVRLSNTTDNMKNTVVTISDRVGDFESIRLQSRDLLSFVSNEVVYFCDYSQFEYKSGDTYRDFKIADITLDYDTDYILYCGDMDTLNTGILKLWIKYTDGTIIRGVKVDSNNKYKVFRLDGTKKISELELYGVATNGVAAEKAGTAAFSNIYIFKGNSLKFNSIFYKETIPDYYKTQLKTKLATIRKHFNDCAFNGDGLVFLTDTHFSADLFTSDTPTSHINANNSFNLIKDVVDKTGVCTIVFGGDLINSTTDIDTMLLSMVSFQTKFRNQQVKLRYCVGNHEYYTGSDYGATEKPSISALYGAGIKYNEDVVLAKGDMGTYYFDNVAQKIRYFIVPCGRDTEITPAQLVWILKQFKSIPNDYHVVCIGHAFVRDNMTAFRGGYEHITNALDAIKAKTTYTYNSVQYDYSGLTNVTPVCIIAGHTHIDGSLTTSGGIPCICTTTDSYAQNYKLVNGTPTLAPRIKGTVNEQAFDVIQFDFTNRKIYCTRIGYGSDREFSY